MGLLQRLKHDLKSGLATLRLGTAQAARKTRLAASRHARHGNERRLAVMGRDLSFMPMV